MATNYTNNTYKIYYNQFVAAIYKSAGQSQTNNERRWRFVDRYFQISGHASEWPIIIQATKTHSANTKRYIAKLAVARFLFRYGIPVECSNIRSIYWFYVLIRNILYVLTHCCLKLSFFYCLRCTIICFGFVPTQIHILAFSFWTFTLNLSILKMRNLIR